MIHTAFHHSPFTIHHSPFISRNGLYAENLQEQYQCTLHIACFTDASFTQVTNTSIAFSNCSMIGTVGAIRIFLSSGSLL
jgi:hypothetical protein